MLVHRGGFDGELFAKALQNTIETRNSDEYLRRWKEIVDAIAASDFQKEQWIRYQRRMPYAKDIRFADLIDSITSLMKEEVDKA